MSTIDIGKNHISSYQMDTRNCTFSRHMLYACVVLSLGTLSGCANNQNYGELQAIQRSLESMQRQQPDQTAQMAALQGEFRSLSGRFEEIEFAQRGRRPFGSSSQPGSFSGSPSAQMFPEPVESPGVAAVPPPIVPVKELEQDEASVRGVSEEPAIRFAEGLAKIRAGRFDESVPLLQEAVTLSYGSEGSAHAMFWIGVAHDGLGDNKRALAAYFELISRFPKSKRTPLALLRQASVYVRLNDSKTAKLTLQKLIGEFPKSPEAAIAKNRIKDMR